MDPQDRSSWGAAFERLVGVMARLRGPGGCPWDREQTLQSLRPFLLEETYEVLDAIDKDVAEEHLEEPGDLLLQVVLQSELRREAGEFDAADVAHRIADKLVSRHPHVFGDVVVEDGAQAYKRWEMEKAKEKKDRRLLDGVPKHLPSLLRAQRVQEKVARVGFDWPDARGAEDKLFEEMAEFKEAIESGDEAKIEHELGDVLFSLVNVARRRGLVAEDALSRQVDRFKRRFRVVEDDVRAGKGWPDTTLEEMDASWERAKREERD